MEDNSRVRPKNSLAKAAGGIRTPAEGESSSSDAMPSDSPTVIDFPAPSSSSDSPTLLDISAQVSSSDTPTLLDATAPALHAAAPRRAPAMQPMLEPGTVLSGRYEIQQVLGEGGMGAVYKAKDIELNRMVALKVIRPDLAGNPAIIDRFKQELVLAHKVTHKNVIRIYDLGEAAGMKFITMEYIEGEDLRSLIRERKKLSREEAVEITQQVCRALEAAHSVGIIHRDLKPQNIMRDHSGRILVMDFGLARTLEGDGMTQTGALVGTMEYMSPEQALAKDLDQRSDLFTVGLILYELLTGEMPFKADSALASLIKRTQERVVPVSDHDKEIPSALSNIVSKCLERDPNLRYQNAGELLADLEVWQGKRAAATLSFRASEKPWGQTIPWPIITAIVAIIGLATIGFVLREKLFTQPAAKQVATAPVAPPAVTLAILPFRNSSGDPAVDWLGSSLSEMLSTDVGQSAHVRTVSPDRLHQVLTDLRISSGTVVDANMLRRIAEFSNADTVISGQYAKFGDQIRIDAVVQDLKHDRSASLKSETSEKELPSAIDTLAESIRKNLAVSSDVVAELRAQSFKPTSTSMDALREYNVGLQLMRQGKNLDAMKSFQAATTHDSQFALAFLKLAETQSALGYDNDAEQSSRRAVSLSDKLPESERYRIAAANARISNDTPKAIAAYEALAKASPEDTDVQFALGELFESSGDYDKARTHLEAVLRQDPQSIDALLAMGRVENRSGNLQQGLEYFNRAQSLAIQVDNKEKRAASLQAIGITYNFLNKPEEALGKFQESLAIKREIGDQAGIAKSLNSIAGIQEAAGKRKEALAGYQEALQIRRKIGDKAGVGDSLLDLGSFYDDAGDHEQALKMFKESLQIQRDLANETLEATCLSNIGGVYFEMNEYQDAQTFFQQALQLREKGGSPGDIADSVHNLAETAFKMGNFDQAVTQYMRALELRRKANDERGAAIEAYSLGMTFNVQGRYGAALSSKQEALKAFEKLKDRTFWMAEIQGGFGQALTLAGRSSEAKPYLDEALKVAHEVNSDMEVAQSLNFQGDAAFYAGDYKAAQDLYTKALQAATKSKDKDKVLISKVNLAKVAVAQQRSQAALSSLRTLAQEADERGLKYLSVESSLLKAEALLQSRNYSASRQELESALSRSETLGLQPFALRAHYLLSNLLRATGNTADAANHDRQAIALLDAIRKDAGEQVLGRTDLAKIYKESTQRLQAAK
jgi:eukaryotic-like serine/threonine-protein kinase